MRKRKLKKFIALILAFVMLFSLGGNVVSANVSDEITEKSLDQVQRENEAKLLERKVSDDTKAFSPGDDYSLDNNAVEMFDLPNNTPKINMEGIPKIKSKSKVRKENDEQRYNVLVLDTSASSSFLDSSGNIFYTADTAIDYVKSSAKKFIEGVQKADGTNYVAIVEYKGSTANVVSEFSTDFVSLNAAIDGLYASQNTRNVAAGLQKADTLINEISNPKAIKNVVLFTTGMTNDGEYSYDGHYNEDTIGSEWRRSDTQVRLYAYSNAAYAMAETLKSKATVYSVGLFQMMENMPEEGLEIVQFFKLFSSELATSLEHFYDVKDPNDLEFIFGEIADKVTTKDVNFYFASGEEKDYEAVCHYSDNYFRKASCGTRQLDGYNHSLSTASLCLALSAFGSNDGTKTEKDIHYKEISVKMKVISDNITGTTIRNEACISEDSDKDGNPIDDRDSNPKKWVKYEDDEDYDNIILKSFDLALRKFIIAVSDDTKIENSEYLKNTEGTYKRAPVVDTSKLNTKDENGKIITTATYNHTKEPVEVKKNDIVVYMLRVYNEGEIDGYAAEIKDHLPSNLEFVDGDFNKQYGWTVSEDGRTVTTKYLENAKINKAVKNENPTTPEKTYTLSYKEVPIMCKVKDTAKTDEKITNIADITKYLDEDKKSVIDRDSEENNVKLPNDNNLPNYKDNEKGDYIPGQEDDDDFEKVIIKKFDLALRKQIVSINHTYAEKETAYNDRYAKLDTDKKQTNTIYDYYDVESNIPTVVENDVVKYSIRVYNEGKIDGTATWVTDILPSGLEYLKDNEVNKKYGWKAFKESSADNENAVKIGEKYYEEVDFDSKEITLYATDYLKDTTIKAYTGEGEASYGEVFMATRVKAKKEVAEGTEYKLRNIAEIGDDNGDDEDSVPGDGSEWKDQDDVDIEDLKLVEFDLALRKWVTQAIVIENGKQTVTETGHQPYDDPEQVVKVELHRKKLNQVTVKFKYSIRVINEGDIAGYAKEVKDYVPEGLKFVAEDNPGWTDLGNNVISTNLLENTLLQPGEYADVEVVLTWINSENNMGVMTNTAEISKDYNEYHVPDRDSTPDNKKPGEDDIDDAPVMLSISTGQMRIYFTLGFIVLVTVAGGVVLIRKYVL